MIRTAARAGVWRHGAAVAMRSNDAPARQPRRAAPSPCPAPRRGVAARFLVELRARAVRSIRHRRDALGAPARYPLGAARRELPAYLAARRRTILPGEPPATPARRAPAIAAPGRTGPSGDGDALSRPHRKAAEFRLRRAHPARHRGHLRTRQPLC
jgi:hypothetical protein